MGAAHQSVESHRVKSAFAHRREVLAVGIGRRCQGCSASLAALLGALRKLLDRRTRGGGVVQQRVRIVATDEHGIDGSELLRADTHEPLAHGDA